MGSEIEYTLEHFINNYKNTTSGNDEIYELFTSQTDQYPFLRSHRNFIEDNKLGYGERAFHYMWYLLIRYLKNNSLPATALEIGVFKGQVISLWTLIAKNIDLDVTLSGITPLAGKKLPNKIFTSFMNKFSRKFRENLRSGNFYDNIDYLSIIKKLFKKFDLDFSKLNILKGYSTDTTIIQDIQKQKFSIIYIDGDHSYETVVHDINTYSGLVNDGGFLVMDDASSNLPGTKFWKGHQSVSDACAIIESMGFTNVLNVGHNRVYQKSSVIL